MNSTLVQDSVSSTLPSTVLQYLGVAAVMFFLARNVFQSRSVDHTYPLPPGPRGKPIIGNLFDLPRNHQWLRVTEWAKEFGDLIYLNIAGSPLVFINDRQTARDILDKQSSITSDRPQTSMMDLMGAERIFSLMRYGPNWRIRRRVFHQEFNLTARNKYRDTQSRYARALAMNLKEDPDEFDQHFKYFSAAVMLDSIYGFDIKPAGDPYVKIAEDGLNFSKGMISGTYLVDAFPLLKSLPSWFPDPGFIGTKAAKLYGKQLQDFIQLPFQRCSNSFNAGTARPSFVCSWLQKIQGDTSEAVERESVKDVIQDVAATAFAGGFETMAAAMLNLVLLMIQYPEVQRKAQEELDQVVGRTRFPSFSDQQNLPYMCALLKELLRWFPIGPLGIAHKSTSDSEQVYRGMRFPKGTTFIANIWAMTHDEEVYGSDTETFKPERFLNTDTVDPRSFVFGFGRRICPGRHLAENTLFISITTMLHLFTIGKAIKEDGSEVPINPRWVSALTPQLEPFRCSIKLRFEGAGDLIDSDSK